MIFNKPTMAEIMEEHSQSPVLEEKELDDPMEGGGGGEEEEYDHEYDEFRNSRGGPMRGMMG